jgi:uncharacterized repeat protein (TIGR03803 family)
VLYGITASGGAKDNGTVFKLTPPADGKGGWTYELLHSFAGGADAQPNSLVQDANGALYGTTFGNFGGDEAFKLTPPAAGHAAWSEAIIYRFGSSDGGPINGLTLGVDGTLYGAATPPGASYYATVYKLAPPGAGKTAWSKETLYTFHMSAVEGAQPEAPLIQDASGALYGTTAWGGEAPFGTVFKLTPPAAGKTAWTGTVLYGFKGNGDGSSTSAQRF